jgi:signal transduction histidine kinase
MEHLLTGVREITKIDATLDEEKREGVNLADLVGRVVEAYSEQYPSLEFQVMRRSHEESVIVLGSAERLAQVAENLLENAVGFAPRGSVVAITVERGTGNASEQAILIVDDEGPGIPEPDLEKIFDRFASNRASGSEHMGLGLSIVRAIVEGYGGTVTASNRKGGGARFAVLLPLLS